MKITKGYQQLVAEAERDIVSETSEQVEQRRQEPGVLLVDLRDVREVKREGKIPGALHVPRGMLEFWIDPDSPYYREEFATATSLILYCNKGWRSALAAKSLQQMGIEEVSHLAGGLEQWQAEERPVDKPE